jgi:hypothetical protein
LLLVALLMTTAASGRLSPLAHAQPIVHTEWIRQFGSPASEAIHATSTAADGIYVAGMIRVGGRADAFLRRYAPDGSEVWHQQFGTSADDFALAVATDASGVYVAGWTFGTLDGQVRAGSNDAFVRKYDHTGVEQWTRQFGTISDDAALAIAAFAGRIFVSGRVLGALPGQTHRGDLDAFVRSYDAAGNELWTHQFGIAGFDEATAIAAGPNGVFAAGSTFAFANPGATFDAFVNKFGIDGAAIWSRSIATSGFEAAWGVAVRLDGVYVAGHTSGILSSDGNAGNLDAYLRKYDADGRIVWTRQFGSATLDSASAVSAGRGGIYVSGISGSDGFTRRYNADGNGIWATQFGTVSSETVAGVTADDSGVYVAGSTQGSFAGHSNAGASDAYLLKLHENVANQSAAIDIGFDARLTAGQRFARIGSFADADSLGWTATVDYGDGTGVRALTFFEGTSFLLNHFYEADGVYTITVCITDDLGDVSCGSIQIVVTGALAFGAPTCVQDVPEQFGALKHHPEAIGFHLGAGTPDPTLFDHYQGLLRLPGPGTPTFYVTRSGGDSPGDLLSVQFDSRNTSGERMRSNRQRARQTTEVTPPPAGDVVVNSIPFDGGVHHGDQSWPNYAHPGSVQVIDDVLVIPLEARRDTSDPETGITLVDIRNPVEPTMLRTITAPHPGVKAGVAGITRLSDRRLLLVITGADNETLEVYISNGTDIRADDLAFEPFDTWSAGELVNGEWPTGKGSHQVLAFLRDCNGTLYLAGTRNTTGGSSAPVINEDRGELYAVNIDHDPRHFGLTLIAEQHFFCEAHEIGLTCDFAAAGGFYVSPAGELILYATEHNNGGEGGFVRMAEFRNSALFRRNSPNWAPRAEAGGPYAVDEGDSVTVHGGATLPPLAKPWAELYADENFEDRSLVLDWEDRFRREFTTLADVDDWDDDADSVIFAAPVGCNLHLFEDPHFQGHGIVLAGTGRVERIPNLNDEPYEIGDAIDSIQFVGATCDAENVRFSWDLDDSGSFETNGLTATLQPSVTTRVALRACGDFVGCDEDVATVSVRHLTPAIVDFSVPAQTVEGVQVEALGSYTNPGNRPMTVTLNWGDGVVVSSVATEIQLGHTYADNGVYSVSIVVCNDEPRCDSRAATVTVANAAPAVNAGGAASTVEGATLTRVVTFADPGFTFAPAGTHETFSATVAWGDGDTAALPVVFTPGGPGLPTTGMIVLSHPYVNNGAYPVSLTIADDDGAVGSGMFVVNVANEPPVVSMATVRDEAGQPLSGVSAALIGLQISLSAQFTDAGRADTHTAMILWGDGTESAAVIDQATGTLTGSHVFHQTSASVSQPFHVIRVSVRDNDGAMGVATTNVLIVDSADGVEDAVIDLQPFANDASLPQDAQRAVQRAIDELQGSNGGQGSNGALDMFARDDGATALAKIGAALRQLQSARAAAPALNLTSLESLLALAAKAAAVDAVAHGEVAATSPGHHRRLAEARRLLTEGDALLLAHNLADAVDRYRAAIRSAPPSRN